MKRLSDEIISEIISLYQSGESPMNIGKKFGIKNNSVTRILRKKDISRNQLNRVSDFDIATILDRYNSGESSEVIANDLGINGSTVCRIVKRNGSELRLSEDNKRKYKINQRYFKEIDSEEKAYFLGFLYADGSLNNDIKNSIRLVVHPKDRDILVKFSEAIYGFEKIDILKPKNSSNEIDYPGVAIYSKRMVNDLINFGCTPKKSFTITFPDKIDNSLIPHFIRGYFDGDGCISFINKTRVKIDITSTKEFLEGLSIYLKTQFEFKDHLLQQRHPDRDTNTRSLQFSSKKEVSSFLDLIYGNASIYLDRKYKLYCDLIYNINNQSILKQNKLYDISKYSSSFVPEFNGACLTSDYLKSIDDGTKANIANNMVSFYHDNGFPFIKMTDDQLVREFTALKNIDPSTIIKNGYLTLFNTTGSRTIKYFSPHIFEVKSGISNKPNMIEVFNDPDRLEKVIYNRLAQNYTLSGNMLRQGIINSHVAYRVSLFNTVLAKYIYSKYVPENGIIYDYSMGFGQRLLASLSLPYNIKYIGVDVWDKSIISNQNIFNYFKNNIPMLDKEAEFIHIGSEDYIDYENQVDFAFSSPPYYNLELYSGDTTQAYNRSYTDFINVWWRTVVKNIYKMLKPNGIFGVNINNKISGFDIGQNMVDVASEEGFKVNETLNIRLTRNTEFRNKNNVHKYEPIYIMEKI